MGVPPGGEKHGEASFDCIGRLSFKILQSCWHILWAEHTLLSLGGILKPVGTYFWGAQHQ